ncbi:MAG: N-acetylglucosamine-6-phosphate deacetylase [Planctomycetaceae bacterium]|nr:N-acetylglucosamine-6-phosphate deacetylase [Planctomycetaceae bacterium]
MPSAPKYVDLQVNGYAGLDFNSDEVTSERLHHVCELLREDEVEGILATIITAEIPKMVSWLRRIVDIRRQDPLVNDVIKGFHIEGPFINETPGYVGAHPIHAVRPADVDDMKKLLEAADGLTRIVTLAPERDPGQRLIRWLVGQKVVVSAGHCNPSLDELRAGIDAGLTLFTHLGNGCPAMMHRHDNIIQRALHLHDRLTLCFIADGVHIPCPTLSNFLELVGLERTVIVTDAIMAARLGPGTYTLGERTVKIGEDLVAREPKGEFFVGSTATMPRMAKLLKEKLHFSDADVDKLLIRNPRRVLESVA